jgi:tetratricopeptide (TPR) repeat protein
VTGAACSCTVRYVQLLLLVIAGCAYGGDDAISFLERRVEKDPDDFVAQNQLAERYLDLLRTTGDNSYIGKARRAAEASVHSAGMPELNTAGRLALARVQLASHEFLAARENAVKLRAIAPDKTFSLGILGDAFLELGEYAEAARLFTQLAKAEPESFESETRQAQLAIVRGEIDSACDHFKRALKTTTTSLTPRQAQLEAWCSVQLGQLYFGRGDWINAEKHYKTALDAAPEYWAALEHIAELRAAQQNYAEATSLYEKVIARISRPELCQALGDLYAFVGKPAEAKPWHDRAATIYLKAVEQGAALYNHHLAGFYSDSVENPAEAVKWARKDLETRHSVYARDAMAWALYRDGQFAEAGREMKKALALGTKDSHFLFHASMIAIANGDLAEGKQFLQRAAEVNPHYNAFHVHR